MIIQCTKDLLKNMRREPEPIPDGEPINPLYTWNANIFRMGRNRMMILQNSMTRCVVILFRPKAADFAALDDRLGEAIRLLFAEMKIPESKTEEYLAKAGKCVITKSGSRKEIGRLVQVIKDLEYCLNVDEHFRMDTLYPTHISMWCCDGILWMTEDQRVLTATDSMREVFGLGKYEGSWSPLSHEANPQTGEQTVMIRNIIFDMVGVLMRFDTESYIEEHHLSEADVAILRKEVFRSLEWAMQDRGSISTEEAERRICDRVPAHLRFAVHDLLYREGRKIVPIDGMRELLQDLKGRGFHLFVLSNTCVHWRSFWEKIPGHELFEDVLISADVGLVKPQPEIFRLACERFGISAGESVFIDDTPANAEAAYYVGMRAVVFHGDTAELRRELEMIILGR